MTFEPATRNTTFSKIAQNILMKRILSLLIFTFIIQSLSAQIGGENVYTFTTLPHTARVAALGGNLIHLDLSFLSQ